MAKPIQRPFFLLVVALINTLFVPAAHSENVYVSCGRRGSFKYDGKTWIGDADFVTSGVSASVSAPVPLNTLRYFTNLQPVYYYFTNFAKGTKVTVTTQFYYGNYDLKNNPPTFQVQYDRNPVNTIFTSSSEAVTYSLTYKVPSSGNVTVYLEGNKANAAFVNTIQVENAGGGGSNVVKIVVPIVVIIFVIVVAFVVGALHHSRKRRMARAQALQVQSPQDHANQPAEPTRPSPGPTHVSMESDKQEKYGQGHVRPPAVYTYEGMETDRQEKYGQGHGRPPVVYTYEAMESDNQEKYGQGPVGPTVPTYPGMKSNEQHYWQGNNDQQRPQLEISHAFTYAQIREITNNFKKRIGKGGSGVVFYGRLNNGQEVAVKVLNESLPQGASEFISEVRLLLTVHHKYIAGFVGYCEEGRSLILIYEYMKGGNLRELLSGKSSKSAILTWKTRLQIAQNVASGLDYLHSGCQPPIIHRDVKTTNILLTEKLEAKIADFGLSKAGLNEDVTYVSTVVAGTPGYIDPQYYQTNRLTKKSDVYSFGVVLLELISGHSPIMTTPDGRRCSLVQWAMPLLARRDIESAADPILRGQYSLDSIWRVADTAVACTADASAKRPTMADVVNQLREAMEMQTHQGSTGAFPFTAGTMSTMRAGDAPFNEFCPASTSSTEYSSSDKGIAPPPAR